MLARTFELPDDSSSITGTMKGHVETMGDVTTKKDRAELNLKSRS